MKKILNASIAGFIGDTRCSRRYRAVLDRGTRNKLAVEQEIYGEWYACERWELSRLCAGCDRAFIDYGQKWFVVGIDGARKEAIELLASETPVS